MVKERSQTNEIEEKKIDNDVLGLTSTDSMCQETKKQ